MKPTLLWCWWWKWELIFQENILYILYNLAAVFVHKWIRLKRCSVFQWSCNGIFKLLFFFSFYFWGWMLELLLVLLVRCYSIWPKICEQRDRSRPCCQTLNPDLIFLCCNIKLHTSEKAFSRFWVWLWGFVSSRMKRGSQVWVRVLCMDYVWAA